MSDKKKTTKIWKWKLIRKLKKYDGLQAQNAEVLKGDLDNELIIRWSACSDRIKGKKK